MASINPSRAREIAVELARPIVEYSHDAIANKRYGAFLDSRSFEGHALEFFDMTESEIHRFALCMADCVKDLFTAAPETVVEYPEVAITMLAAAFHLHIVTHRMKERVLDKEFKLGQ